ncbi:hypothetical protein TCAL_08311 [Tigriopus californicus]|uniref:Uncharacterized protein n=1 Tax=Tigriopus californicus TaxID=6832 RepID=A0A553P9X1_TIGCA|nr:uncharacterized protein LOC131893631 [Tigriopus californicus]TRY74468.1 hypothetical protein TCAL_08311 [Tigriopus californicus]|eukprot:TCALIF_08311-PA protein Name:"Protein of unknown function" AED:0.00 eAED:0.00 QI:655/1/1/1/0.5/0.8/5/170/361
MGPSGESYSLLNLTPSDDENHIGEEHTRNGGWPGSANTTTTTTLAGMEGRQLPDLNLPLPAKALTMRQKVKRKIRLKKRRDRNQSTHRLGSLSSSSSSSSLLATSTKFTHSTSSLCSSLSTMGIGFAIIMAFVGLTFFVAQLHVTLSNLRLEMEKVSEDRQAFMDRFSALQATVQEVAPESQTSAEKISALEVQFAAFSTQVSSLNESLVQVEASLKTAPELLELPQQIQAIQNEMAKFGSRLTEVESKLHSPASPNDDQNQWSRSTTNTELDQLRNETSALQGALMSLEERFRTIGIKITSQMKKNQERSEKLWENMAKFREDIDALRELVKVEAPSEESKVGTRISDSQSHSHNTSLIS